MFDLSTKILVVDDSPIYTKVVSKVCTQIGLKEVKEATNGEEAWNILSDPACGISLVISDWNMPKMAGIELLQKLRQSPHGKNMPFIMMTSEREKDRVVEAVQLRVNGYICKPFDPAVLVTKLEEVSKKVASSG